MRQLSPFARHHLSALNPPGYLEHRAQELAGLIGIASQLPAIECVEIGSNRGRFLEALASGMPDHHVLGLEWREKWVKEVRRRLVGRDVSNAHCLRVDARVGLPVLVPPASLRFLFVLYPDPWWKAKHQGRRLIDASFLRLVSELLRPGGMLIVKTDVMQLRRDVADACDEVSSLEAVPPWEYPDETRWGWTQRERRCMADGTATFRLYLRPVDAVQGALRVAS